MAISFELTGKYLSPEMRFRYGILQVLADSVRGKPLSVRDILAGGVTRAQLNCWFDPTYKPDSAVKARCVELVNEEGRRDRRVQITSDFIPAKCPGCIYGALACPIASAMGIKMGVSLVGDRQGGETKNTGRGTLDEFRRFLETSRIDTAQLDLPLFDLGSDVCVPASSSARIRAIVNPDVWEKYVRYQSFYESVHKTGERLNPVDATTMLNWSRLVLNGVPTAILLTENRINEKLRVRMLQGLRYALPDREFSEIVAELGIKQNILLADIEFIEVMNGLDRLRSVLDDINIQEYAMQFPHVYDFYRYLTNGHDIQNILTAFGLILPENTVTAYRSALKKFLTGELSSDFMYPHHLIPSAIVLRYFLEGKEYKPMGEERKSIDEQLLGIGGVLFGQEPAEITKEIRQVAGGNVTEEVAWKINMLRHFYRIMLMETKRYEVEGGGWISEQSREGYNDPLIFTQEVYNNKVIRSILRTLKKLPFAARKLVAMPTDKYPESKYKIRKGSGNRRGITVESIAGRMCYSPNYFRSAINAFTNLIFNLTNSRINSFTRLTAEDWLKLTQNHRVKSGEFTRQIYRKMYPEQVSRF